MKKTITCSLLAALTVIATPAFAQMTGNDTLYATRAREAAQQRYNRVRNQINSGYGNVDYGYPPIFYYPPPNEVKQVTARRGGVWVQKCPGGVVPIGRMCESFPTDPSAYASTGSNEPQEALRPTAGECRQGYGPPTSRTAMYRGQVVLEIHCGDGNIVISQ